MIRTSVDLMMSKTRGEMNCSRCAKSPPATPEKNAESVKARNFARRVSTPVSSAAISSSRTASTPRPKRE